VVTNETYPIESNKEQFLKSKIDNASDLLNIQNANNVKKLEDDLDTKVTKESVALIEKNEACCNGNEPLKNGLSCQETVDENQRELSSLADFQNKNKLLNVQDSESPLISRKIDEEKESSDGNEEDEDDDEDEDDGPMDIPEAPEGGWGWMVVCATFVTYWLIPGMIRSYGAIYLEILDTFPECTATQAGWIPAFLSSISIGLAPISAVLAKIYTCRNVVFVGGFLCASGLIISFFATSIYYLYISFGLLAGIGAGLCTTPSVIVINSYFVKKRALASGICLSGAAFGSFTLPILVEYLVRQYRFRGTMLILGGILLHVCAFSLLFTKDGKWVSKPSKKSERPRTDSKLVPMNGAVVKHLTGDQRNGSFTQSDVVDNRFRASSLVGEKSRTSSLLGEKSRTPSIIGEKSLMGSNAMLGKELWTLPPHLRNSQLMTRTRSRTSSINSTARHLRMMSSSMSHSINDVSTASVFMDDTMDDDESSARGSSLSVKSKKSKFSRLLKQVAFFIKMCLDFSLFRNWSYCITVLAGACIAGAFPHVLIFAPAFAQAQFGSSKLDAGIIVSITSAVDLVGRISYGWFMDLGIIKRSHGLLISLSVCAVGTLCIPLATSYPVLAIFTSMYGFGSGTSFMLLPVILADNHGVENLPSTYGLLRLFQGSYTVIIPPIAGALKDITGVYHYCFVLMGLHLLVGAIAMLFMSCARRRDIRKEKEAKTSAI